MNENYINNINKNISPCVFNNWSKHFGAYFMPDKSVVFRLLTFRDVKNVSVEIKRRNKPIQRYDMIQEAACIWYVYLKPDTISNGERYRFVIDYKNELTYVKDPCSMRQDEYFKWSVIYNHSLFKWTDRNWIEDHNPNKISRLANDINKLSNIGSLRIYEMHIGTFTQEGTFLAAKKKLKEIADMKFNAIELMPVENTYSFNWGYDGVDKYAPNHTYGTPDDLKELVNYAHEIGLNVIMDFVPNHLGPDIAELQNTGPYIGGLNCFGYKFNFEGDEYSVYVRNFIIGAALNWLVHYHCDGLRVDMTKFMCSDFTMKQMAAEINYHVPSAFLIAEDGRDNDSRVTRNFTQSECEENELRHEQFINKIKRNDTSLAALGFDTEWDFLFHKQIIASVLGVWDCRVKNLFDFDYSLRDAQTRVKYIMSHDEIGNIDGTRLISKILAKELNLEDKVCECLPDLTCKLAAHAAHKLSVAFITGEYEKFNEIERKSFCQNLNLSVCYSAQEIFEAYKIAIKKHKLVLGKIYSIPGPKMVFQGDEEANLAYFKFFRKVSTGLESDLRLKGYEPGKSAFLDSKLNSIKPADKYLYINNSIREYTKDLNILCSENIALNSGHIEKTIVHENSDTHAIHARKIYNEIFSVSNFSRTPYLKNYGIMFPKGKWREILNSDDPKYGGEGKYLNKNAIKEQYSYISLSDYSITFFEKIQ